MRERERERARKGEERGRERETHVRATTMYFGAALHTPRGGQCPSLLRLKEGAEGREGWREQGGGGASRSRGRQGGGHRRGVEKNEQTSSEKWRGRVAEERPGAHSFFFPLFSLVLSSLSLFLFLFSPSLSLFLLVVTLSRLSLSFALRCTAGCSGGLLTSRTIFS